MTRLPTPRMAITSLMFTPNRRELRSTGRSTKTGNEAYTQPEVPVPDFKAGRAVLCSRGARKGPSIEAQQYSCAALRRIHASRTHDRDQHDSDSGLDRGTPIPSIRPSRARIRAQAGFVRHAQADF